MDDRQVVSGIVCIIKHGLMCRDAPKGYGRYNTIYNRFIRWSCRDVSNRIFAVLAGKAGEPDASMIGNHLNAHRTAIGILKGGLFPGVSGAPMAGELLAPCCLR